MATATTGMDSDEQSLSLDSQPGKSSLACRNHLVWNEQLPTAVPSRYHIPYRFHDSVCLMDRFTRRRQRRPLDHPGDTQFSEYRVQMLV